MCCCSSGRYCRRVNFLIVVGVGVVIGAVVTVIAVHIVIIVIVLSIAVISAGITVLVVNTVAKMVDFIIAVRVGVVIVELL